MKFLSIFIFFAFILSGCSAEQGKSKSVNSIDLTSVKAKIGRDLPHRSKPQRPRQKVVCFF